jgi:FERM N-terminal domain
MKSTGQVLFDEVVRKLRLLESDYFDLEYTDVRGASVSKLTRLKFYYVQPFVEHAQTSDDDLPISAGARDM